MGNWASAKEPGMRRNMSVVVVGIAAAVFLAALGERAATGPNKKADAAVVIPEAKKVAMIRFVANGIFPQGPYDKKRDFEVKLSKENHLKPVLNWLKELDWDRSKAEDIKRLRMVADLIITATVEITKTDKTSQLFEIQPAHIIQGNFRWKIAAQQLKKLDGIVQGLR
jgi:membrane glycosyltransferase